MADALAQIVCVREDGKDPRTVVPMAPVAQQIEALKSRKEWPGKKLRPRLELWSDGGVKLDPKTGTPIPKPEKPAKPAPAPSPAEN